MLLILPVEKIPLHAPMKPSTLMLLPLALFSAGLTSAQDAPPPLVAVPPTTDPGPVTNPPPPQLSSPSRW